MLENDKELLNLANDYKAFIASNLLWLGVSSVNMWEGYRCRIRGILDPSRVWRSSGAVWVGIRSFTHLDVASGEENAYEPADAAVAFMFQPYDTKSDGQWSLKDLGLCKRVHADTIDVEWKNLREYMILPKHQTLVCDSANDQEVKLRVGQGKRKLLIPGLNTKTYWPAPIKAPRFGKEEDRIAESMFAEKLADLLLSFYA